jgi:hypothetical protein
LDSKSSTFHLAKVKTWLIFPCLLAASGGQGASPTGAALCDLQVEAHALAIDQDCSDVNQLLPRAVIALVAAQRGEGEEELDGLRTSASARLDGEMKRAAESQTVELGIILEVTEHGTDQMRHVFVEDQRGKAVA